MIRQFILAVLALSLFCTVRAQEADSLDQADSPVAAESGSRENWRTVWAQANEAYANGQFHVATGLYEQLVADGYRDPALLYNLGNSYFQQNQIGKAILNFRRAQKADPSDSDIAYNLELAQGRTKDKINAVPTIFIQDWFIAIRDMASPDGWAVTAIWSLALCLLCILLWLLGSRLAWRKAGFFGAAAALVILTVSLVNAFSSADRMYNSSEAIVTNSAALIKSAPAESGKDLFVIHEGTAVKLLQTLGEWMEVELADGNRGWVLASAVETI